MHHLYLSYQPSEPSLRKEREALEGWCRENGVKKYTVLEEKLTSGRITNYQLNKLLKPVLPGDTVVAPSLSRLGRSINMLLSLLKMLHCRGVTIITVNDGRIFLPDEATASYITAMESFMALATGIKTERGNEAIEKARADGKQFGRPLGKKERFPQKYPIRQDRSSYPSSQQRPFSPENR